MFDTGVRTPAPPVQPSELAGLDLGALDDDQLIDVIVAGQRLASYAAAVTLAAIADLFQRRVADGNGEFAADEIAAALHTSRMAADRRVTLAVDLDRLPGTAAALAAGKIDLSRAGVIVDATTSLPDDLATAVEASVLDRAPQQTPGQLGARLRRVVLAVDPAAAEHRHQRAVAGRRVRVQPLDDGMAELHALLPADQAVAVYQSLDRIARGLGAGDPRGMDARRADILVALLTGLRPDGDTAGVTGPPALIQVTVPASTLLGTGDTPGELAGYGPIPASMTRRLAVTATWRRLLTHPDTGTLVSHGRTRYPAPPTTQQTTTGDPAAALALDPRWTRLLTAPPPSTGPHDEATYRPSAALADYIRARDQTCRFPGCRAPAYRCDLDHTIPHPEGETCPGNLGALCRHHHRLKHHTRWTVTQHDGTYTWTSPTGRVYVTHPPPLDEPDPPDDEREASKEKCSDVRTGPRRTSRTR